MRRPMVPSLAKRCSVWLLPMALLTASITQEATAFYGRFKSGEIQLAEYFQRGVDALPEWVRGLLARLGLADLAAVQGKLVDALVDNVLRPILVGKETRLPDYLVLVATLGGLSVFGLNGFVIGPVIAAIFIVAWDIFAEVRQEQRGSKEAKARLRP